MEAALKLHPSITLDVVMDAARESMFGMTDEGFCITCGEGRLNTESDAERYPCEVCETPTVYGAGRLLEEMAP